MAQWELISALEAGGMRAGVEFETDGRNVHMIGRSLWSGKHYRPDYMVPAIVSQATFQAMRQAAIYRDADTLELFSSSLAPVPGSGKFPGIPIGILSQPNKMPGGSTGHTAWSGCPHAIRREDGSRTREADPSYICSHCYADGTGSYVWPVVQRAYRVRYRAILSALKSAEAGARYVAMFVDAIGRKRSELTRVNDSGDLLSPGHAMLWHAIASALPHKRFWIPTRAWRTPSMVPALQALHSLPNVEVRPSALRVNDPAPTIPGLGGGTGVGRGAALELLARDHHICPALGQGGACHPNEHPKLRAMALEAGWVDCSTCFATSLPVIYPLHN